MDRYTEKQSILRSRAILTVVLVFLVPPLGIAFMWRMGVFRFRGRVVLTCVAALELMILLKAGLFGIVRDHGGVQTVQPVPMAAVAVTVSPDESTLSALSNMEELIAKGVDDTTTEIVAAPTPMISQEEQLARQEEILNTTVYSVFRNAKYYHKNTVCGTQSNGRTLTVREALAAGLGACPDCNPPQLSSDEISGDTGIIEEDDTIG